MSHKAIFLDRDDTLLDDPGYIDSPDQVKLLSGAAEAVSQFKRMGYRVVIITNQSAIARGMITEKQLEQIHQRMKNMLSAEGAAVDGVYYCPYHPNGTVPEFARESALRKPGPGMLHKAAEEMDIDLSRSWMIGDRFRDIEAGKAAGCHTILVDVPGKPREQNPLGLEPDRKAVNLREAVNIIRMYEFHQKAQAARQATAHTDTAVFPPAEDRLSEAQTPPPAVHSAPEPVVIDEEICAPVPESTRAESKNEQNKPPDRVKFHTTRVLPKQPETTDEAGPEHTHHLLQEILSRLKTSGRDEFYEDFSIHKLLAGMAQVLALGCLIFSLWFWLSPEDNTQRVQLMIGYAVALQLLVISLLLMHRRD